MKLPELLAGPVLRRASTKGVTLWLATSRRMKNLRFQIYQRGSKRLLNDPGRQELEEIQVGQNFWVYLVRALPPAGKRFPGGALLSYEVGEPHPSSLSGIQPVWKDQGQEFAYHGYTGPSFLLQARKSRDLNLIYGSCRKMHGRGMDANRAANQKLRQTANSPEDRPHALLLTGDQIYGDDVPDIMIRHIQELARALFGLDEAIGGRLASQLPIDGRREYLQTHTAFSSGESKNHLLTFGEYCATYLLAWNDQLWPGMLPTDKDIARDKGEGFLARLHYHDTWKATLDACLEFKEGTKVLRRMLANVPTYMIFDDHEVTDDWNLNPAWTDANIHSRTGGRILANAIAAYWLFQASGNSMGYFIRKKQKLKKAFLDQMKNIARGTAQDPAVGKRFDMRFAKAKNWSFLTPTRPAVVFADTRTRRKTSPIRDHVVYTYGTLDLLPSTVKTYRSSLKSPLLMDETEQARLGKLLRMARKRDSRIIVVTPTPVYGISTIEGVKQAAERKKLASGATLDLETFSDDPHSYFNLMQQILNLSRRPSLVVFLGGDVHYGFSVKSMIDTSRRAPIMVAQFCSSATKNSTTPFERLLLGMFASEYRGPQARFWGRSDLPDSDMPGPTVRFHGLPSRPILEEGGTTDQIAFQQYHQQIAPLNHPFGEVLKFERGKSKHVIEKRNNMGYLQLKGSSLRHHLMVWNNGYQESLQTEETVSYNSWPVYLRLV